MWGPALSEADYLAREAYLTTVPLARDGGITHWILTVRDLPEDGRPILSSCESLRKRAVYYRDGEGEGQGQGGDGVAHGIASVFTEERYRGKGDIGKTFYARHGWAAFESCHVAFRPDAGAAGEKGAVARAIGYHELAELCAVDERMLRAELKRRGGGKTHVALLPELDALLWHLMREDYMTKCIFGKTPTVRGAVAGEPGKRVWAVWMRGYYGGLKKEEGNTLHVLRVVVEDPEQPDEELVDGFRSIVQIAQAEAAEWKTQDVQMWNPTPKLRGLIDKCGVEYEFVDRDKESIASLMWYGDEPTAELDWVANEKYAWC
ncbi:hypothetical protein NEMBOFW57_006933 [Staphylotrichum longicolle]|uniref:LYC1 C-terminal domain-containing protein n=1 Tax=Staphylotrichum longicolle TaxID=669026 RepID=A0AAD4EXF2_9PEZI|nr:hypothetical protein NEMBOFW57_006933 [Staphylotrichum longicolle]